MVTTISSGIVATTTALIRKHLEWIHRVTIHHPVAVLLACLVVFVLSAFSITRIHFEGDIFKMFPQTGAMGLLTDTIRWTGSAGNAYFLLEGDKEKLVQEAEVFAGKLNRLTIDGAPAFKKVKFRIFDPAEAKDFADFIAYSVTHPQAFVAPDEVPGFLERLRGEAVGASLRRATTELAAPGSLPGIVAADPLYLRDLILPRLKKASQTLDLDTSSPYFMSRDGKVLIIIGEPSHPVTDTNFARKLVAGINEARTGAGVRISCTGAHLSAVADEMAIKENVIVGVSSSLLIVLALFYVAYRRFLPTLLIPFILVYGVVLALGVGGLLYPTISIISFAFTSLIVGLGTDYTIHLYDRFHYERSNGASSEEAVRLATVDTGHALFTAASTTGVPFLALVVSDVRALAELGLLVGLGVIFSLYATYFTLPPLLLFMEKRFPLKEYKPLPTFGLGNLWNAGQRYWRKVIVVAVLSVIGLALAAVNISFESELKNLQPKSSEAFLTQEKVDKHLSISPKQLIVAVEGASLDEVLLQGDAVEHLAEQVQARKEIVSFSSLGQAVNGITVQKGVLAALSNGIGSDLGGDLRQSLTRAGFALAPFEEYVTSIAGLRNGTVVPVSEAVARMSASPFRGIVERHFIYTDGRYHLLTYVNYKGEEFRQKEFLAALKQAAPAARVTGVDLVSDQLTESVRKSFVWALMIGGAMVLLLLISHFNNPAGIFYSLFPVFAGVVAMLGSMPILGQRLNFMNVVVLVTILGMGSDYGLHVAHRVRNCSRDKYEERFVQAGRAVLLSGLTTIAGFGSLALADYGALASIGWATNSGVAATTMYTLVVLPAFMYLFSRDKRTRGLDRLRDR